MFVALIGLTSGLSRPSQDISTVISKAVVLPQGNVVALPNPEFTARYDLSRVPPIPVSIPSASTGPVLCVNMDPSYCSWACSEACVRPTDIVTCQNNQEWAVTYDDGPSEFTNQLLDTLEQAGARTTFFVTGSQVQLHPEVLARAYTLGHQIGIHTWSHRSLTSLTTEVVVAELEWTSIAIENVIGVRPKYFRPPFGDIDDRIRAIADAMDLIPVIWNFDSRDFEVRADLIPRVDQTAQQWRQASSGIISLQHDLYAHQVSNAQPVLERILASEMNLVTVASCIGDANPYLTEHRAVTRTITTPNSVVTISISNINPNGPSTQNKKNNSAFASKPLYLCIFIVLLYI